MIEPVSIDQTQCEQLCSKLDEAITRLARAPQFAKFSKLPPVTDLVRRVILAGGLGEVAARAVALEQAGVFLGTDWAQPQILVPAMTRHSLRSADWNFVVIETLSELRLLAIAMGEHSHPDLSAEQAHQFLTQVLAVNLAMLFNPLTEAERETQGRFAEVPRALLKFLAERIGFEHIIDRLIHEIWRMLRQRPIQLDGVKQMITQISACRGSAMHPGAATESIMQGADRLISALYGPTQLCREDPGVEVYRQRIDYLDDKGMQAEAAGFVRSMHDTGLVSPYHAVYMQALVERSPQLLADALGLSGTGRDCLMCYHGLVLELIRHAVTPQTPQAIFGLSSMLERGILYQPAVAPSLWRQIGLPLSDRTEKRLDAVFGTGVSARAQLLHGVLLVLGLPLGIGQGNNPTCQSARALSIWSYIDPDYLLQLIASAARDDEIVMHFEGEALSSRAGLDAGINPLSVDLDPVSLVVVPHLDHIYQEMGRRCLGREGDPHRWINPEFHGWRVGRGFSINVDVTTGDIIDLEDFLRRFYAFYHPYFNGNQPLIHPQPIGIAITDSAGRFIGWHAISIQRVALDSAGVMRVFFYNPNNDSGQDWGDGVVVSTADNGERYGESSLEFETFASRIYIFHYDAQEPGEPAAVAEDTIERIRGLMSRSWGQGRMAKSARA